MSESGHSATSGHATPPAARPGQPDKPVIHRVCIQCNGMFKVTADNYAAKQCPNCHKG